jgi:hypothetical protein
MLLDHSAKLGCRRPLMAAVAVAHWRIMDRLVEEPDPKFHALGGGRTERDKASVWPDRSPSSAPIIAAVAE